MHSFNKHYFNTCVTLIIVVTIFLLFSAIKILLYSKNTAYKVVLNSNIHTLLVGDSHAIDGFNPKYISKSINIAQVKEPPMISYYKIKKLLIDSKSLDNIVLAFSYHSIHGYGSIPGPKMLTRYHLILDEEFYQNFLKNHIVSGPLLVRYLSDDHKIPFGVANDLVEYYLHKNAKTLYELPYIGSFYAANDHFIGNIKSLDAAINRHYFTHENVRISDMQIDYLHRIKYICRLNNVKLYLVNTPVHKDYFNRIPADTIDKVDELCFSLEDENTFYLNLTKFPMPDSCFYDYDHLNKSGSVILSKYLDVVIKNNVRFNHVENTLHYPHRINSN